MPPALSDDARAAVLAWYEANGRSLPFRATCDPWAILVSEVMAQQTQIARVADAWTRFLDRFPTPGALASASPADVLRAWQGMGYDRRAMNLRRAAQTIRDEHGGHVPDDLAALGRLPGIGPYTARAVAAIAFGRPVGAVDTNVRRVLGRALEDGDGAAMSAAVMQDAADASVDQARPGDWTHAVMDIGATLCRPQRPRCEACPLRVWCRYAGRAPAASPSATTRAPRESTPAFTTTTRWLRGRIVDRLRATPDGAWTAVPAPIGNHDAVAVAAALEALARDGLVELDGGDRRLARLATD
jgi:A/G-specific adenine glycosylase